MAHGSPDDPDAPEAPTGPAPAGYESPAIVWEERYEPVGFGISCAKQQGNSGCFPGPVFE